MGTVQEWNFEAMIYLYLRFEYAFCDIGEFDQMSKNTQIELLKLQSILNAFTEGKYDIQSRNGRKAIEFAFTSGFDIGESLCSREKIIQLKNLFTCQNVNFQRLRKERILIKQIYEPIFQTLKAGYKYMTLFNTTVCLSNAQSIIASFKSSEIDSYIYGRNEILVDALKIILGISNDKHFTTHELIEKYNYPKFAIIE